MTLPISPEAIVYDFPSIDGARVSPDGTRIVYVQAQVNRETGKSESQVWLCDIDGGNRRQITRVGTGNGKPAWSPDSTAIAYVSQRDGDHPFAIALLSLGVAGEARVLTTHSTPPVALAWSPGGETIAYALSVDPENPAETPRDPKAPAKVRVVRNMDYKLDGFGFRGLVRMQLFRLNVATGERKQLTSDVADHMSFTWSPNGETIAANLWLDGPWKSQLAVIDPETGVTTPIADPGTVRGSLSWSPDGRQILFDTEMSGYAIADVESGTIRVLNEDIGFMPDGLQNASSGPVWLDANTILAHGLVGTRSGLWKIDVATGAPTEITRWDAIHGGINLVPDGTSLIQTTSDLDGGVGLASIDIATGSKTQIFTIADDFFANNKSAQWELVTVDRGDYVIEGILLKPADFDPAKSYPVLMDVHGGPQGAFLQRIDFDSQVMATNGFIVLMPNPRGSTGYGKAFSEAVFDDWGNEDWKDLQALLDVVLERPYADRDRTGIYGYSYGGYMTSWAIGHTDRFKAAVCGAPPFDLESMYGSSDVSYLLGGMQWGGTPWDGREEYARLSPSGFIQNAVTPTLIVHGEADERCPIGQGEQMFISLKKLGVETEFARYPGGSHGFPWTGEPAHRIDYYGRLLGWFKKYLGDPA